MMPQAALVLIVALALVLPSLWPGALSSGAAAPAAFPLDEVTAAAAAGRMTSGRYTARQIAELYLRAHRGRSIAAVRSCARSSRSIPTRWRSPTRSTPSARRKGPRGPLHGIPVLIKDNIDTADQMMTTAGSLALAGLASARATPSSSSGCARPAR